MIGSIADGADCRSGAWRVACRICCCQRFAVYGTRLTGTDMRVISMDKLRGNLQSYLLEEVPAASSQIVIAGDDPEIFFLDRRVSGCILILDHLELSHEQGITTFQHNPTATFLVATHPAQGLVPRESHRRIWA